MTATTEEQSRSDSEPSTAIVFPGMGPASCVDVGRFMVLDPFARRRLAAADAALGYSVLDRFRAVEDDYSEFTQVAFLINSLALADRAVEVDGVTPEVCVGPSFGQKAAAVFVESLPFAEVVRLTAELARCEEDFFTTEYTDVVTHSFVRTPTERLTEILAEMDRRGEWYDMSGYLDRGFYLVSVRESDLKSFKQRIRDAGGYSMYSMRPPVHARAFGALRRRAEEEVFSRYQIADPKLPVIADQDGALVTDAAAVRTMMLDTFDRPLNWPDTVAGLTRFGVKRLCFTGSDSLFHRLSCTTESFEVTSLSPRKAMRPAP
jgi:[acyl-carrier-protein] S-malonyltransferase